jgi:nitroreductase
MSSSADIQPPFDGKLQTAIDQLIRARRTEKVLATEPLWPDENQQQQVAAADKAVHDAIQVAGWAPFHYDRRHADIAEPWRMHLLLHDSCRVLATRFDTIAIDVKPGNKVPAMLRACGALILVNWIPETELADQQKLQQINREHLAATSSATQNLLLALTSRNFGTYWSSGGLLGETAIFEHLEIAPSESLIAAVFVDYPFLSQGKSVERIEGKNRALRSSADRWMRQVRLK